MVGKNTKKKTHFIFFFWGGGFNSFLPTNQILRDVVSLLTLYNMYTSKRNIWATSRYTKQCLPKNQLVHLMLLHYNLSYPQVWPKSFFSGPFWSLWRQVGIHKFFQMCEEKIMRISPPKEKESRYASYCFLVDNWKKRIELNYCFLVGGFNPFEKYYIVKLDHESPGYKYGVNAKKCFKPPPTMSPQNHEIHKGFGHLKNQVTYHKNLQKCRFWVSFWGGLASKMLCFVIFFRRFKGLSLEVSIQRFMRKNGAERKQVFVNVPLEVGKTLRIFQHTPGTYQNDPQPTVYVSEFLSFGGLGKPGVCSRGMLGFP